MEAKELGSKVFKGCGCLSIGFCAMLILVGIIGTCVGDDDKEKTGEENVAKPEQVEKKDTVIVNEPLEGDPYKELDELIGLSSVKEEVRSLANFVKVQKQREAKGLKTAKVSYHLVFYGSPGTGKTTHLVKKWINQIAIKPRGKMLILCPTKSLLPFF